MKIRNLYAKGLEKGINAVREMLPEKSGHETCQIGEGLIQKSGEEAEKILSDSITASRRAWILMQQRTKLKFCSNQSQNSEVRGLEERMRKMGYRVNFEDNVSAAESITRAYENLTEHGFRLPSQAILFTSTNDSLFGLRPHARQGLEEQTPLLFNKNLRNGNFRSSGRLQLLEQNGIKSHSTFTPEGVIYHEAGHFLHEKSVLEPAKAAMIWAKAANNGADLELAREVGYYAMTTPNTMAAGNEFVAEVFAGIMSGKKYGERVMNLYYALGGPKI